MGSEIAAVCAQGCPGHTEITEVEVTLGVAVRQMRWRIVAANLLLDLCVKEIGVGIYVRYRFPCISLISFPCFESVESNFLPQLCLTPFCQSTVAHNCYPLVYELRSLRKN